MTFLELCQTVARESGTVASSSSFTTVNGASGRVLKIVGWTRDAWTQIQNERLDWLFRLADFSHALTIGQGKYSGASFDLSLAAWVPDTRVAFTMSLYDPAIGVGDEGTIPQVSHAVWRAQYGRGVQTNNRPILWAIAPDGQLCLGPAPDKAYVLNGQYKRKAQQLLADTDVPIMPEDFHGVIVAQALRNMIDSDEALETLIPKAQKYEALRNGLVIDQTPQAFTF